MNMFAENLAVMITILLRMIGVIVLGVVVLAIVLLAAVAIWATVKELTKKGKEGKKKNE